MSQGAYRDLPPEARISELELENVKLRRMLRIYMENDDLRRELAKRNRIHCIDCRHARRDRDGWRCNAFPIEVYASKYNANLDCNYFQLRR